jgi:hypothetical protein
MKILGSNTMVSITRVTHWVKKIKGRRWRSEKYCVCFQITLWETCRCMGVWLYVINFSLFDERHVDVFVGIMAELSTGQALFGRDFFVFF